MPDSPRKSAKRQPDEIGRETLAAMLRLSEQVRRDILRAIGEIGPDAGPGEAVAAAEMVIRDAAPELAGLMDAAILEAYLAAGESVISKLPESSADTRPILTSDAIVPRGTRSARPPDTEPVLGERLPLIEAGAENLIARQVMTRDKFDRLTADARQAAFTVARLATERSIAEVRELLVESVQEGGTLRDFRRRLDEEFDGTPLGAAHLETVFRTSVQAAYSAGQEATLDHPLVGGEFPYLLYSAIHDGRARPEHLKMEQLGLDGTAVYRRDDPVMQRGRYLPPWGYNCRCATTPLTVKEAARRGVKEAQLWLETGVEPASPAFVDTPPFPPEFA